MYKNINISAAATVAVIAGAANARVRVRDGAVEIRPTVRQTTVNMPKGEMLRKIGVKGSGSRIGIPTELAAFLPDAGTKVALADPKYGWYRVVPTTENAAASISA